jgi:hypothetical protein
MFSLNFRKTGWLVRYLIFRSSTPFTGPEPYLEFTGEDFGEEKFDELLYLEVEKNGMFFGCPVISRPVQNLANKLNFPKQQGGTILLYLETLFSIALIENESLTSNLQHATTIPYHNRLLKIILLALRYHIPGIFYRIPEDILLTELLAENETLHGALTQFEEELLDSVTLKGYSSLGNRQNNFAFSKLYFFLLWTRAEAKNDKSEPEAFLEMDKELREEMILTFAALIWANDYVDSTEQQVIEKYIEQTKLTEAKQNKLNQRILQPVKIEDIQCSSISVIISRYMVEQLILLSLIDNQEAWQEKEFIEKISLKLELTSEKLEQLYFSVAEFFSVHNERLEFLKNNAAARQFQDYMNDKVVKIVKKNVDNIMKEIGETKELSELLLKATTKPLTTEEKQKVQDQLIDVAKSIPALAIFALPGGGILLPILIKVLPFNILPSSFQDEPVSQQELSQ